MFCNKPLKLQQVASSVEPNEFLQWDEQALKVRREQCIVVALTLLPCGLTLGATVGKELVTSSTLHLMLVHNLPLHVYGENTFTVCSNKCSNVRCGVCVTLTLAVHLKYRITQPALACTPCNGCLLNHCCTVCHDLSIFCKALTRFECETRTF